MQVRRESRVREVVPGAAPGLWSFHTSSEPAASPALSRGAACPQSVLGDVPLPLSAVTLPGRGRGFACGPVSPPPPGTDCLRFSCSPAPRRWQGGRCPLSQCHGQQGLPHCLPSGAALPQRYLLPFFPPFRLVRRPTSHCFAQPGSKVALNSSVTDAYAQPPDF